MGQLPVGHGHGAARNEDAGRLFRKNTLFLRDPLFQFVTDFIHRFRKPGRIVVKENLVGQKGIQAGDGGRVGAAQGREPVDGRPFGVHGLDRALQ